MDEVNLRLLAFASRIIQWENSGSWSSENLVHNTFWFGGLLLNPGWSETFPWLQQTAEIKEVLPVLWFCIRATSQDH